MQSFTDTPDEAGVRQRWGWYLAFGVLLVVAGLIALYNAVDATLVTTLWVGFVLVFGGIVELVSAFTGARDVGGRVLHLVLGVIYVAGGLLLITNPVSGAITLAIVIAVMLIVDGAMRLWFGFTTDAPYRGMNIVLGIIDILLGLWLWTGIPVTALAIGFYVGFALLLAGISWIALALRARSLPEGTTGSAA